jgi:ATP-dependent DNA helicase RecG
MTDIDLSALLTELCAYSQEEQWLEFKHNDSTDPDQIGEYISALSNGATLANKPFGYMVWGIEDSSHSILGTTFRFSKKKKGNQALELYLRNLLYPSINFEIFEFKYDTKHIVLLRIPASQNEPTSFKGKTFIRIGSNTTNLEKYPDFVRIIYNSQEDWSKRLIENASIKDLDDEALAVARKKFKEKNINAPYYNEIDKWDNATFLDKAKITVNGKITNTAILLLGKNESVHYLSPALIQIVWKLETEEKAYEIFGLPFLLTTTQVMQKIRNIQYKFFPRNQLLAITVDKYDTRSILEALHNCIAHQNYLFNSRIIVTEKIDRLIFSNAGSFFEGNPEDYITGEKTPKNYRNSWLMQAMSNLGMIDSMGFGIHNLFVSQRERFFPLPDYTLSQSQEVALQMYGQEIDENYAKVLMERKDLSLMQVLLLDKVQKQLPITDDAAGMLKKEGLIEGRKPNYYISANIAEATGQKATYSKNKAFDKQRYFDWILKSIKEHGSLNRKDIDEILWKMLPDYMNDKQRENKIRNLIAELRRNKKIINKGSSAKPEWFLAEF